MKKLLLALAMIGTSCTAHAETYTLQAPANQPPTQAALALQDRIMRLSGKWCDINSYTWRACYRAAGDLARLEIDTAGNPLLSGILEACMKRGWTGGSIESRYGPNIHVVGLCYGAETAHLGGGVGRASGPTPAQASPSFDCRKGRESDEIAICAHADLAALDVETTAAFERAKRVDRREALATARRFLRDRKGCAGDAACIKTQQESVLMRFGDIR